MGITLVFLMLAGIFLIGGYQIAFAATSSKSKEIVVVGSKINPSNSENTESNKQLAVKKKNGVQPTDLQKKDAANDGAAEEKPIKTGTK